MQGQRMCIGLTFKHKDKKCAHMKHTNDYKCTMRKSIGKNVVQHVYVMHNTPLSGVVITSKCHNNY